MEADVLIVGAGPTGLVLALWLHRQGVGVRIIERNAVAGTGSRALAVQARTLELYRQLDLADAVVARGHRVEGVNLWARGRRAAHIDFGALGAGLTPYPFVTIFPQDEHEALLESRLRDAGIEVERGTELLRLADDGSRITADLRHGDGSGETCTARYIAGCDGAGSTVRKALGIGFGGSTYEGHYYVADIAARGPAIDGDLHIDLDEADFLGIFPLAAPGHVRLVGTIGAGGPPGGRAPRFEDAGARVVAQMQVTVGRVNWFSTYRVHHRVAAHFRKGRAFLLGDAGHIHSPVGGQGMNTGILDAINLAWKLAEVIAGRAGDDLLDSYEAERIGFARRLVATTDRIFGIVTARGRAAGVVRARLAPAVLSRALRSGALRRFLFRTVSQIALDYRDSALSAGRAGAVAGGDRLPWVAPDAGESPAPPAPVGWQVRVHGSAGDGLADWCRAQGVALQVPAWRPEHGAAGIARDATYLLRPDGWVALADPSGDPQAIARYFDARGIRLPGGQGPA
ncbi:MAG: FAD-dependent monooxygenase [Rubellimicrobium sp.]|nr:FAD-dependent monooxygenase [Rubellimicrobium sp.]